MTRTTAAALLISQRPGRVLFEIDPFRVRDVLVLNTNSQASWVLTEVFVGQDPRHPVVILPDSPDFLLAAGMLGFLHTVLPDQVAEDKRLGHLAVKADEGRRITMPALDESEARAVFRVFGEFAQAALVTFAAWVLSQREVELAMECGVPLAHTRMTPPAEAPG